MEIVVQTLSDVTREVEITATAKELEPHFEKAYQKYQKNIEIKGFRKGKAPIKIVKKLYGDLIENDSLDEVATEMYKQAVQEKELKPIGEPTLIDLNYKKGESFKCRIRYDIRPQIQLKEYKGIEIQKIIHTVTDEEVENELKQLQLINAKLDEVDTVTDTNHVITATVQDLDENGIPIAGKKSENIKFYLNNEQLDQQIKDALKQANKGGVYRINLERKQEEVNSKINMQITVNNIHKVVLPTLDNEFISKITKDKFKTVDDFRKSIKDDLISYWQDKSNRQVINSLIYEIIKRHDFQVPESLLKTILNSLLDELKNEYPNKQLPAEFDIQKFNEENRAYAIYQAKWVLLREELIKEEKIDVSDEDLEKLAEKESERIKIPKERLIHYYKSSEQIKDRIIGDKLIKVLLDSAKIKEVPEKNKISRK